MIVDAMTRAFQERRLTSPSAHDVRRVIGLPLMTAIERLLSDDRRDQAEAVSQRYIEAIRDLRAAGKPDEPLYPGAKDAIAAAEENGWLLGVATGKSRRGLDHVLKSHGLLERFVTLQTADTSPGKPDPDMLYRAASETGGALEHMVMIGDTAFDMEMARRAGVFAIGVTWGYHDPDELTGAGADVLINDFSELRIIMDKQALGWSAT